MFASTVSLYIFLHIFSSILTTPVTTESTPSDTTTTDVTTESTPTDTTTTDDITSDYTSDPTTRDITTQSTPNDTTTTTTTDDITSDYTSDPTTRDNITSDYTSDPTTTDVPCQVEELILTPDSHSINVKWTAPSDETCFTRYVVIWVPISTGVEVEKELSNKDNCWNITDLHACVEYEVSVTALNDNETISTVNDTTRTETVVPGQVEDLNLTTYSHSISVNWKKPSVDSYCVERYVIEWVNNVTGSKNSSIALSEEDHVVIEYLDACVDYEVSVRAVNYENQSAEAVSINTRTETVVPGQVEDLYLTAYSHKISVNWKKPSVDSYCVEHYVIEWVNNVTGSKNSSIALSEEDPVVIEYLDACVEYEVSVRAVNDENQSAEAVSINNRTETVVPGQVEDLSLTAYSHNISVNWKKPNVDSYCVEHYVIEWVNNVTGSKNSSIALSEEDPVVIEVLDACVDYEVSVRAVNAENQSAEAVSINTRTETVVPGQVEDLSLTAYSHKISVNWKKPSVDSYCVEHYVIEWVNNVTGSKNSSIALSEEDPVVIEYLDACVEYEVSVRAVNDENQSAEAVSINNRTETVVPGQVEDLYLTAYSHKISVNWKKPSVDSYCVEHYVIEWVNNVTGSKNSSIALSEEDPVVIEYLDACVEYEVSVRAVNDENQSEEAVSINNRTETVVPGQVEDLSLTAYSHKISVNWKKPSVDSYCVEHYVIEWVNNVTGSKNSSIALSEEDPVVIEYLDACVEYEVSVRAVNDENQSAEAVSINNRTETVVPGQVEDLYLTAYSHKISVNWKKPSVDSYCVEHYVIEWVNNVTGSKNSSIALSEEDPVVIEYLDACVEYEVSVRAVNDENQSAEAVSINNRTETVVPGQVEDLSLTAYSHNISVNWKKPNVDSYCVEHYVIEWVNNVTGSKNSSIALSEEDPVVIEVLDACVDYEVSVRAVNAENQSAEAVSINTRTETVVPGQVEDLSLTAYSHKISVNWKKPSVDSYCVEHYVIEWVNNVTGSKNSSIALSEEDPVVIEYLDACVEYEVSVRAVNDENQSAEAVSINNRTETVVPGQVEDLYLTAYSHKISVNWKKPSVDSYCVEHYVIEWVNNVTGSKNSSIALSEEDPVVIEYLDACVEYEVSVRAVNDENQSEEAVSINNRTETVVPGQVEDLSLTAYSHKISVNWKKPSVDSYCVEHYVIEWVNNVTGSKNSSIALSEEDPVVIEYLDACVEYEVSVRAVNDENQSAEAVSINNRTETVVPGQVEDLYLTAYSHKISVNWKKPSVDSYCVEHYVIEWVNNVTGSKNSSIALSEEDPVVIEYLDACVEYEVSVRAVNDENQSAEAVSINNRTETVVPGQVEDLSLTAYSHNISVNWKKPNVDSYCVEHYVIEWVNNVTGSKNSSIALSEEDPVVIEVLDACVDYEVSVRAVNAENQSAEAVSINTRTETVVPGQVEDLSLTAYSHKISVNWKKPSVDSYCVEHYVIEWVNNVTGSKNSSIALSEEDPVVIEYLDACVEYEVSVRAVNDENQSAEAVSINNRTETVVPGQVEDLYLTAYSHKISVNWKKPSVDSYCVEHYVIEWVNNVTGSKNSSIALSEEDPVVIEYLDACVEYEVSVRAVNDENQSEEAVSINNRTETVVPGQVEDLSLTAYSHKISVNWKKPSVDSYCVEHYVIEWVNNVTGSKNSSIALSEEDPVVIEYLDACVEYEVSVRAVNDENQSAEAVSINNRTETVVPGQVEDLYLTAYSHKISVNWKKPSVDSYCVEHYVIEWMNNVTGSKNSSIALSEEDPVVIEDLDACVDYEVLVRAVNAENQSAGSLSINTRTETVVPGQLEDLYMTPYSHNISVNWKKPNVDSYCVEHYVIEWVNNVTGSKNSSIALSEEDPVIIDHLDACVDYEVSVRAVNAENQSAEAVSINTRTETVVPGQVEDLSLTAYSHKISVNWKKPTVDTYCVERYVIEWENNVTGSKISSIALSEEDPVVIEDLDACVDYEVSVRAVNAENQSAEAVSINTRTETVVPGQVEDLYMTPYSHNISVNWKKPNVDSYCVEHYVIEWVNNVTGSKNSSIDLSEEDPVIIDHLDACVDYEVSVRAVNAENQSAEAVSINTRTETVVPGQVEDLSLTAYSHNISVNWKKPNVDSYCVEHYVIEWVNNVTGSKNKSIASSEEDPVVIEDLDACVDYEVSVRAVNGENQCAEAVIINMRTEVDVPGQVEDLYMTPYSHNISVNWKKPTVDSYCVERYVIEWVNNVTGSKNSSIALSEEDPVFIEDLDACVDYEVSVRAVNAENQSAEAVSINTRTETVAYSHNISVNWKKPTVDSYCVEQYVIEWVHTASGSKNSSTTLSELHLNVIKDLDACVEYEVSVRAMNDENQDRGAVTNKMRTEAVVPGAPVHKDISCLDTEKVCLVWNLTDLSKNRCTIHNGTVTCKAEDNPELPVANEVTQDFENDSFVVNVVGLSPSTTYSCVAYITNESGSSKNSSEVRFTTIPEGIPEVPVAMIVGALFAIIAIGLIAIVVVTYHQGILVWPPAWFTKDKQATVRPQPVLLKKFPEYCAQMLDTPTRLGSEYQLLATLSADISEKNSSDTGQLPENRRKNRYTNILPYDATRVTLDLIDGDPNSHYINASFIKGYSNETEYIATQGPKEETCFDFWRMVFQLDVRVIVMVTNLVEQEKVKCHQYYPNRHKNIAFEDMTIWCSTQTEFSIHTARTLVLMKGDMKRQLSHLHFREWPDFGVPQSTDVMIDFRQTVRRHALKADGGLILVHCSAGVGRTGTLIAVDILLQHIHENKKVDIFGTVFKLREQRINMVQTEGQYTYIYRCIKDAVEDPTIVNPGTVSNNQLEPIYENVGISLNPVQYENLPKWRNEDVEA